MFTHISPKLCKLFGIQIQNIKRQITSNYTHKHQNHFLKVDCLSQSYQISHVSQRLMIAPPPAMGNPHCNQQNLQLDR